MKTLASPVPVSAIPLRQSLFSTLRVLSINTVALLIVAVILRSLDLGNIPGINGDEAWSGVQALRILRGEAFDWRTPTGNPINFFFMLPLVGLHAVLPASFALLRVVPVVSGLLALAANYFLCRRAFDARTALVSTLFLALAPIDIAYSRFAWDASQSLLATVLVLYPAIIHSRHSTSGSLSTLSMAALAAAVIVHPTNLFAAPLLVVPALYQRRVQIVRKLRNTAIPAKTWTLVALVAGTAVGIFCCWQWLKWSVARLHGPTELARFSLDYLRLFSGTTVYAFISGAGGGITDIRSLLCAPSVCGVMFGLFAIWSLSGMYRRVSGQSTPQDQALVISWLTMLAAFFVIAGPSAIEPHFERYGICLIAPAALVLSRGVVCWLDQKSPSGRRWAFALALFAWFWPASFYAGYFDFVQRTGGHSHLTFRTATVEPKLSAFRYVLEHRAAATLTRIICHEWWNYWPLEYLALSDGNIQVFMWDQWLAQARTPAGTEHENTWFVEFSDSAGEAEVLARCDAAGLKAERKTICDYAGRALLSVIGTVEKLSQNY